ENDGDEHGGKRRVADRIGGLTRLRRRSGDLLAGQPVRQRGEHDGVLTTDRAREARGITYRELVERPVLDALAGHGGCEGRGVASHTRPSAARGGGWRGCTLPLTVSVG